MVRRTAYDAFTPGVPYDRQLLAALNRHIKQVKREGCRDNHNPISVEVDRDILQMWEEKRLEVRLAVGWGLPHTRSRERR